jgi:hypothetical protein
MTMATLAIVGALSTIRLRGTAPQGIDTRAPRLDARFALAP